jgi:hypothetical protein
VSAAWQHPLLKSLALDLPVPLSAALDIALPQVLLDTLKLAKTWASSYGTYKTDTARMRALAMPTCIGLGQYLSLSEQHANWIITYLCTLSLAFSAEDDLNVSGPFMHLVLITNELVFSWDLLLQVRFFANTTDCTDARCRVIVLP